jgi:hypothetical protein
MTYGLQSLEDRTVELQQAVECARDTLAAARLSVTQAQTAARAHGCNLSTDDLASLEAVRERSMLLSKHKV